MHLITMAHLGEAQGVINLFNLKRINSQVFENETLTCLITGEGPFEAAIATASQLSKNQYQAVINLGVAGSFSPEFEVGLIYPVRSIYLAIDGKPQFKSFKSFEKGLDCLTSFERILSPEKAIPLTGVAQLVDREAWGVAMAAKNAGVEFFSYKLISDQAGSLGACEIVKEKAEGWSQKLAQHLKENLTQEKDQAPATEIPGFHFTFSTRIQFDQMIKKLSLREEVSTEELMDSLPLKDLREETLSPKDRTRKLISHIETRLDPLKANLDKNLENWKKPFIQEGIHLQTDATWESPDVKVSFTISNDKDLEQKIKALSHLSTQPFLHLRSGHVE